MVSDINQEGLIDRLPLWARPYALLARLDRPIGIWLLLLPGWWAIMLASGGLFAMTLHDWWIFILFGVGAIVMRAAGCVINDLWDRDLDAQVERTRQRPLAAGMLSPRQAMIFLVGLLVVGCVILIQMNFVTVLLGVISLPLVIAYPLMKRFTWWPQAFLGLTFNFGVLMGWSAITEIVGFSGLLLYAGAILWTLGYDTIYAHQDMEDDALAGIKSTALKFGEASKKYVAAFFAAAWVLIAAAGITGAPHSFVFLFLLPAAVHMGWQLWQWHRDDTASALRVFKSNRDFGLIVLAAFALS
jgi:4-hydroxybenzoate polyprenyltransferase